MSGPKCDAIELAQREKQRRKEEYQKKLAARQEKIRARERAERERKQREEELIARERERKRQAEEAAFRERQREEAFNELVRKEYLSLQRFQEEREEKRRQQEEILGLRKRFEEARCLYQAAAELAGKPAEEFSFAPERAKEQIGQMCRMAEAMQEQTVEKECRAQVNALIDKVITDMGYELMAEKTCGGEEETRAGLYRYRGNTAISVIESNGQFTMEVVALDRRERLPRPEEAQALYETMGAFCEDYEKIKEKLEDSGQVVSTNIFHMPPDKRLARVINRETYETRSHGKKRKYDAEYTMTESAGEVHREQGLP